MAEKSVFTCTVSPQHVDFTQHASISSMCDIILDAAGKDAYNRGYGINVLASSNLGWVLSRMCLELDYMPREYTSFTLHTWISDFNRLASTRNITLTDDSGSVFGRAVTQWCVIDLARRTPADINIMARMHEGIIVDVPSPCDRPQRITAAGDDCITTHRVAYSDIDFNLHMNTMRYIDIVCDTLPIQEMESMHDMRLDINFIREARYGDDLSLYAQPSDDKTHTFEYRNAQGDVLCRMALKQG